MSTEPAPRQARLTVVTEPVAASGGPAWITVVLLAMLQAGVLTGHGGEAAANAGILAALAPRAGPPPVDLPQDRIQPRAGPGGRRTRRPAGRREQPLGIPAHRRGMPQAGRAPVGQLSTQHPGPPLPVPHPRLGK